MAIVLNMNHIELVGRLTHEPEYVVQEARTPDAEPIKRCKISVAVTRDRFKPDQAPETDFFNVTAWGKKAEVIAKYFHRGDPIMVFGEMRMSRYTDRNGVKREAWTVELKDFKVIERPNREQQLGTAEDLS